MKMRGFYIDSEHEVQHGTNSIQTISSTSTLNDSEFQKIRNELLNCKTHQDCERFIHKYDKVNPLNTILFQKKIESLVSLAKGKSERLFFEENKSSIIGLESYLKIYPNGKHVQKAHEIVNAIKAHEIVNAIKTHEIVNVKKSKSNFWNVSGKIILTILVLCAMFFVADLISDSGIGEWLIRWGIVLVFVIGGAIINGIWEW